MRGVEKERWLQLCEEAATEQDPAKLIKLIAEIDRLLAEKENRLKAAKLNEHGNNGSEAHPADAG